MKYGWIILFGIFIGLIAACGSSTELEDQWLLEELDEVDSVQDESTVEPPPEPDPSYEVDDTDATIQINLTVTDFPGNMKKKIFSWDEIPGASLYMLYINDELVYSGEESSYVVERDLAFGAYKAYVLVKYEEGNPSSESLPPTHAESSPENTPEGEKPHDPSESEA
jgi:hypothetical protein